VNPAKIWTPSVNLEEKHGWFAQNKTDLKLD